MDYQAELQRTEQDIVELERGQADRPADLEKATRLAFRLYHRASLTGQAAHFEVAVATLEDTLSRVGPREDLCLLKANLDLTFHRLAAAQEDLEMVPTLPVRPEAKSLLADVAFQKGQYERALRGYEEAIAEQRSWGDLARLAWFKFKLGELAAAEDLYAQAADELTAKQMRSYAWLELQRGVMDLSRGRFAEAGAHYARAAKAYPGYWLIDEHHAELLGAQGQYDAAAALYRKVIAQVPKPEYQQALGELYTLLNQPEQAQACYEAALNVYLASVAKGQVHYYHHLCDYYVDVVQDGPAAVKWARQDLALRENFATLAALAWSLDRAGEYDEALSTMDQALASGVVDARLFHQAGTIYLHAGRQSEGEQLLRRASALNPHHNCFHVHR